MTDAAFHPDFSLAVLTTQLNAFVPLWGGLTRIDNDGTDTIGVYDDAVPGATIVLRIGRPAPGAGERTISTGRVFVQNTLQTVTAYAV